MTLDEALKAREESRIGGYIDTNAIERLCELLPGEDPRHPFHGVYMLGKRLAQKRDEIVMKALEQVQ